jgi:hypothetical protein
VATPGRAMVGPSEDLIISENVHSVLRMLEDIGVRARFGTNEKKKDNAETQRRKKRTARPVKAFGVQIRTSEGGPYCVIRRSETQEGGVKRALHGIRSQALRLRSGQAEACATWAD